jgi:hypothetical protein
MRLLQIGIKAKNYLAKRLGMAPVALPTDLIAAQALKPLFGESSDMILKPVDLPSRGVYKLKTII